MTAQTFSASVAAASTFSTEKKKGGSYKLTSTAVTALGALTTASTVSDALDILSTVVEDSHSVSATGIGFAAHIDS